MNRVFICIVVLSLFSSCIIDTYDSRLTCRNSCDYTVYVWYENDTFLTIPTTQVGFQLPTRKISVNEVLRINKPGGPNAWEQYMLRSKGRKLHLFFLSADTLKRYATETIVAKQLYVRRLDLSLDELKNSNWQVISCEDY